MANTTVQCNQCRALLSFKKILFTLFNLFESLIFTAFIMLAITESQIAFFYGAILALLVLRYLILPSLPIVERKKLKKIDTTS
jgi:hypothetical protein